MALADTRPARIAQHPRGERRLDVRQTPVCADRAGAGAGVKTLFTVLTLVVVAYAGPTVVRSPNGASPTWLDGWGVAAFELVAGLLVLVRAYVSPRDRKYALWLGLGSVFWALGDFALTYESLGGATPATISLANWLWSGSSRWPAYVGVMVLMERDVRKLQRRQLPRRRHRHPRHLGRPRRLRLPHDRLRGRRRRDESVAINLVYPVGDLLLFGLTLFGVRLLPVGQRARWCLIALAGLANAAGDISALFGDPGNIGWFLDSMAWPVSLLLISASVWLAPDPATPAQENRSSGFAVPTVASALALLIPVRRLAQPHQSDRDRPGHRHAGGCGCFGGAAARMTARRARKRHRELEHSADAERASKETLQAAVRDYTAFAARVADGDLTATVSANGSAELAQLADSLNTMVSGLAEISQEIQAGVHEIGDSTTDILSAVSRHTDEVPASSPLRSARRRPRSTSCGPLRTTPRSGPSNWPACQRLRRRLKPGHRGRGGARRGDGGDRAFEWTGSPRRSSPCPRAHSRSARSRRRSTNWPISPTSWRSTRASRRRAPAIRRGLRGGRRAGAPAVR